MIEIWRVVQRVENFRGDEKVYKKSKINFKIPRQAEILISWSS